MSDALPPFAQRMEQVRPSAIRDLLALGADPSILSFGGGYPDATLFPRDLLQGVFRDVLADPTGDPLQYAPSDGLPKLRAQIAALMTQDGTPTAPEDVLILQGSQQGLDFAAKMLVNPGDTILVEDPTFLGALIAFAPAQPRYAAIPMDADGMDMDALEATLRATPSARLLYTVPDFQNPTGATLSLPRRQRLIDLANQHDIIVLEDTPYRHIRFAGDPLPTLKSLDTQGRVIHLGSFSKILVPALRIGWAIASPPLLEKLSLLKVAADTQTSTLNMAATSLFLESHDIWCHIATLRTTYAHKKEVMLQAIRQHFPQEVTVTDPQGGLFTWARFPHGFDATAFLRDHALPKARVAYVPGGTFFATSPQPNHARINFSAQSEDRIRSGIAALGQCLKDHMTCP
ncbi:MAG: PLP-dependent aminotransferase family protein [Paracoccaceae bacterium]